MSEEAETKTESEEKMNLPSEGNLEKVKDTANVEERKDDAKRSRNNDDDGNDDDTAEEEDDAAPTSSTAKKIKTGDEADDGEDRSETAPIPPSKEGYSVFNDNDVLSGRGGGTNVHPGNRNFRDLINLHRRAYLKARKNDKPSISRAIVRSVRESNGKFLKKDEKSGLWFEIGDDAAREKTSQALRQRAPEMRKLLFDTEREEARVLAEEHLRQQRMMMGMPQDAPVVGAMPMGMVSMPIAQQGAAVANMAAFNPAFFAMNAAVAGKPPIMGMPQGMPAANPNDPYQQMFQAAMMQTMNQHRFLQQPQQQNQNGGGGGTNGGNPL